MCFSALQQNAIRRRSESLHNDDEFEQMAEMFHNAKFIVTFSLSQLDDVISEAREINVLYYRDCSCYEGHSTFNTTQTFRIKSDNNRKHTIGHVLKQLEAQGFSPGCDHIFVEALEEDVNCVDNIPTFIVCLGS